MLTPRGATPADTGFIRETQALPAVQAYVGAYTGTEIADILADPAQALIIAEANGEPAGFAHLRGVGDPAGSVELYRLAMARAGQGLGRVFLNHLMADAFGRLQAHRLWLDVFPDNARARRLYRSLGFVEEGTLREVYLWQGERRSAVLMSVLAGEYAARSK